MRKAFVFRGNGTQLQGFSRGPYLAISQIVSFQCNNLVSEYILTCTSILVVDALAQQ